MLDSLPYGAVSGSLVAGLFGSIAIRLARHLEGKLAALRQQLFVQAAMLVVFAVGVAIVGRRGLEAAGAVSGPVSGEAAAVAVTTLRLELTQRLRDQALWLPGLAMTLLFAVPSVLLVLRELQTFVLHQRTDLMARDQAAASDALPKA